MVQNINLEEVKRYNATLKQYKDKAASLNAEIEYTNKELDSLCAELTAELGVTVTRDNIEQIYNEQVAKINSTLQSGNAVLAKIASEEQSVQTQNSATQSFVQSAVQQPQMVNTPVQTPAQAPFQQIPNAPVPGSVFGGQPATNTNAGVGNTLPPLFSIPQ
ncbi:MAG: hypothetical protein J6A59_10850 [Lachnospiraceae bacterium]|nr:hypothetical protein [Lachnospiraceae bacterium]